MRSRHVSRVAMVVAGSFVACSSDDAGGGPTDAGDGRVGTVFEEKDGLVGVEAEHFDTYTNNDKPREWVLTTEGAIPTIEPDADPAHLEGASGGAYLEMLPDTRQTDEDPIQEGESIYNRRGTGPMMTYRVYFNTPGTYHVWVRAYSTGGEDNGIHVGINGEWPDSGYRIQFCRGKNRWTWSSALRDTDGPCGRNYTALIEVPSAGEHTIMFSAREDGFEFDKWVMSTSPDYEPEGEGPTEATR